MVSQVRMLALLEDDLYLLVLMRLTPQMLKFQSIGKLDHVSTMAYRTPGWEKMIYFDAKKNAVGTNLSTSLTNALVRQRTHQHPDLQENRE